jgi:tetratricopeptide (TPR) repeat protein
MKIAVKVLRFLRKVGILDFPDFYLARSIYYPEMTIEEYEKSQWCELFEKIEKEPDNPYNYYSRAQMRDIKKFGGNRQGAIEDFTQVIKLVLANPEKYVDIDLYSCYFSVCQNAKNLGDILMENKNFQEAEKYYNLSIVNGQEFIKGGDLNNKTSNYACRDWIGSSSEQLNLIKHLT